MSACLPAEKLARDWCTYLVCQNAVHVSCKGEDPNVSPTILRGHFLFWVLSAEAQYICVWHSLAVNCNQVHAV